MHWQFCLRICNTAFRFQCNTKVRLVLKYALYKWSKVVKWVLSLLPYLVALHH